MLCYSVKKRKGQQSYEKKISVHGGNYFSDEYIDRMNYENYGGTPLLGINSSVIVGHGISNDIAIKNMILLSKEVHEVELSIKIQNALQKFSLNNKE